jgi:hypothetical protein
MIKTFCAAWSLIAIMSAAPAAGAAPVPGRAWAPGDGMAGDAGTRAGMLAATVDGDGMVTYRDPVGAPTRIATPVTASVPDAVLALPDLAVPAVGRAAVGDEWGAHGADPVLLPRTAEAAIRASVGRFDLRGVSGGGTPAFAVDGFPLTVAWPPRRPGAVTFAGLSREPSVPAGAGVAAVVTPQVDRRGVVATRTGSVRSLPQSVNGGILPEPATWATMIVGFAVIGLALRRKTVLRFV